ncbi:MAG: phosphoribosylaminoimidazolesuccinocarboxamide synthase [Nanoarchaeota archaeon]
MGSVKDLRILVPAYENSAGKFIFEFSDRYSIFDYGEMPDHIIGKGAALAVMAAFNFEELAKRGIETHYKGLVHDDKTVTFSDLKEGSDGADAIAVEGAVVYHPIARPSIDDEGDVKVEYDYSFFEQNRGKINNFLVPLEIIFRNGLPSGSSVFKRIDAAKRESDPKIREEKLRGIYQKLGVSSEPNPGDMLPRPVMTYTTKLEPGDRTLTDDEAYKISGLASAEFGKVRALAFDVNDFVTEQAEKTGLKPHWDGKVEMVYFDGLKIVDVVGTLDEDRFGVLVSKEILRQWYKQTQPEFVEACDEWKKTGEGWQERLPVKPMNLPTEFSDLVSQMYMAATNKYTERRIFNVPGLEEVVELLESRVL